jgi:proteasome lid subunit RPN8/RPN11
MIKISANLLAQIHADAEKAFPEEGAGFLFGTDGMVRKVLQLRSFSNSREDGARHNRYLIAPKDYLNGELEAERLHMTLLGVFHSHPDHPNLPSDYDRDWAQPYFSYVITSVEKGKARASRSWRLLEDRSAFVEEPIDIDKDNQTEKE